MSIDSRFIVNLKGKDFCLYAGLLDAATKAGLKEVSVKLLQFPAADNGGLAIAEATVVFEDGRIFTEIGDCAANSCSAAMLPHCCRLAATRAKGRAFRDGLNIAAVMVEELGPDPEPEPARHPPAEERCCLWPGCGVPITAKEQALSQERFGKNLCPRHAEELAKIRAKKAEAASG